MGIYWSPRYSRVGRSSHLDCEFDVGGHKMNLSEKFWMKYLKSNCIERLELVETIAEPLMKTVQAGISVQSFVTLLNSYFEDLVGVCKKKGVM